VREGFRAEAGSHRSGMASHRSRVRSAVQIQLLENYQTTATRITR
jgi:hypothetical protein